MVDLAALLAFGSGALDVLALTHLGGVFASMMTGNLALMGFGIAHVDTAVLTHTGAAVAGYALGVGVGTRIAGIRPQRSSALPHAVTTALIVELIVLAAFSAGWAAGHVFGVSAPQLALLITAAVGMGLQSAAVRQLRVPLTTTYLTGTLTALIAGRAAAGPAKRVNMPDVAAVIAFLAGAAASGLTLTAAPAIAPLLCLCPLASVIVACGRRHPSHELPSRCGGGPHLRSGGQQGDTCSAHTTDGNPEQDQDR
ncbi:hypothetical protein A5735_08520 [Mycolicibacter heraklionensis]|nr:hypothetical protein A5735_08520 [Mycolicibacter heraklionensis]